MKTNVIKTDFPDLKIFKRGKVRDVYDLGDTLLMVATDRISAFDVVIPDPIPDKGKILTQISLFWFDTMVTSLLFLVYHPETLEKRHFLPDFRVRLKFQSSKYSMYSCS